MAARTFRCALTATITVDDETVKSAMLGFGLSEGLNGPPVEDEETVFRAQQAMLGLVGESTPRELLQKFLVNGYLVPHQDAIAALLERALPGSTVELTGIDVDPASDVG